MIGTLCFLILAVNYLFGARFEITSNIDTSIRSFSDIIDPKIKNLSYISNSASLSFTLKDIALEKTSDSTMNISVSFKAYTITDSSDIINSLYLRDINSFYQTNRVFIDKVYTQIFRFPYPYTTLTFGRMPYKLSDGVLISDNGKGLDGLKLDITSKLFADIIELFYFKEGRGGEIDTTGINYKISSDDGIWQFYGVKMKTDLSNEPINTFTKTDRLYYGFSYSLEKNKITYSFEFTKQYGRSYKTDISKNDDAYAFKINSSWPMTLPIFGNVRMRAGYIKSTAGETQKKNKTFYSYLSERFSDLDYKGLGTIYKAYIWGISKTSSTISGLPDKLYGIRTVNVGLDIPFERYLTFSLDFSRFKSYSSEISNNIGKEYSFSLSSNPSQRASLLIRYSSFIPQGALNKNRKTKGFFLNIKVGF